MMVRNQPELPAARRVLYESFRFLAGGLASLFTDIVFNFFEERETLACIRSIRRRLRWMRTTWREGDVGQRPPRRHNHGKNTDALNSLSENRAVLDTFQPVGKVLRCPWVPLKERKMTKMKQ